MTARAMEPASGRDIDVVEVQLGRAPRGEMQIAHRCPCGAPDVVRTTPRLADGTPFPTLYYATCPRLASAIGTLEASGLMRTMERRLAADSELAARYAAAHQQYLADRLAIAEVTELAGISAGGMPSRVKCLHVLAAHALAVGPGVNPLGDEVLAALAPWWTANSCGAALAEGQQ
ncbi:MAG: DUF501 domain-containing protein [Candidatus Nanopelagicales bacterium]|nr:DUF501 domain-containing protein [Candidatus Nanopelagicales bacterium]